VTKGAPVVTVVTGLWPLAQAATEIGQGNVRVVDVVPAGDDPTSYQLGPAAVSEVDKAALVVQVSPSLQPSLGRAAARTDRTLTLLPLVGGTNPYVWLNPYDMERVSDLIKRALDKVDPAAAATFANGLDNFDAQLGSLDADYQSTLSDCPSQTLVTVGDAFGVLHPRYPITIEPIDGAGGVPVRPDAATVDHEVSVVRHSGVSTVYDESWIPQAGLIPLTAATDVKIANLDTLEGPPPDGWPKASTYFSLMESNLGAFTKALSCPPSEDD
jgi:ABC-type Zn uptake system ZnuABC Zn-binding protein ZnuA